MSEFKILLSRTQLTCPICLDLLRDPVAINCGHSYCMGCIKGFWDQNDSTGIYSCPECRQTFSPRPVLGRNIALSDMVEKLKKRGPQATPPAPCYAGPGDATCDVCTEKKQKAVKSCLTCLFSYCKIHLKLHNTLNPGNKHTLVSVTEQLREKICTHHSRLLEAYCCTDQQCVCLQCVMDEHKGHDTVSAADGRTLTQSQLRRTIQKKEEELQELRQSVDSLTLTAHMAEEDSERVFSELIVSFKRRLAEIKMMIRDQGKAELSQAKGYMERLEQQISELKRRDAELERLAYTEDHIYFLQCFQSLCGPLKARELPTLTFHSHASFQDIRKALSNIKDQLDEVLTKEFVKISYSVRQNRVLETPEPQTRAQFLQYGCQLTLDTNTVHRHLCLSEENRLVLWVGKSQPYPDHSDRFDCYLQVLCKEGLSGRCYWEVEWRGLWVLIAVSYKSITRKGEGNNSCLGRNDKSWGMYCSPYKCFFRHNNKETAVSDSCSYTIGVYLDHEAGTLSFYSVSNTMTLLHRVQTTFSHRLYPGFFVYGGGAVKFCHQ